MRKVIESPRNTGSFYVLPREQNGDAQDALQFIHSCDSYSIETAVELATEQLKRSAKRIRKDELIDGHQYGVFFISYNATALRGGRMVPNTVEAYITLWTYEKESGSFRSQSAWGGISYKRFARDTLLIE